MVAAEAITAANLPLATPMGSLRLTVETPERIQVTGGGCGADCPQVVVGGVAVHLRATLTRRADRAWEVPEPAALTLAPADQVGKRLPRGARGQARRALGRAVTDWVLTHPLVLWAAADQAVAAEQHATQQRLEEVQAARRKLAAEQRAGANGKAQLAAHRRQLVGLEVEASRLRATANRLATRRQQLAWLRP